MSTRRRRIVRACTTAALTAALAAMVAPSAMGSDLSSDARAKQLSRLVRHDCGSCHGMRLTGGLGPALTPTTLRGRSVHGLAAVIALGRADRAMPGWAPILSSEEMTWIAAGLLDGRFLTAEEP